MARIPLNDLLRHTDALGEELRRVVDRVLRCGWYVLGPEVEAFEQEFAAYCGTQVCVGVGNGTDALELALRALGVRPGDTVATVANAGMYSTTAIRAVGAHPVFIDVDPRTCCMCVPALAAHIGRGLRDRRRGLNRGVEPGGGNSVCTSCRRGHGPSLRRHRARLGRMRGSLFRRLHCASGGRAETSDQQFRFAHEYGKRQTMVQHLCLGCREWVLNQSLRGAHRPPRRSP